MSTDTPLPFTISRHFPAPRERVFRAWTERDQMNWFGPVGFTITHPRFEMLPGGTVHYCMKTPDGHEMWGRWVVREIDPPRRLVFVNSFSDAEGGLTRHPGSATWPQETLSTITFDEQDGGTLLAIEWLPINATDTEVATFNASHEGMKKGWTGSLDQLGAYLAKG